MSRRGREGAPTDEQLLEALRRLVEVDGIVKASERLAVSYRTAANCHESRHVSRKMRGVLHKYLREQGDQDEVEADAATEEQIATPAAPDPRGGEDARLQEPGHDISRELEALRKEVASLRERVEVVEGRAARGRGRGDDRVDVGGVDAVDRGRQPRSAQLPRRVFPELITENAEPGEEQVYGAAAEFVVEWREAWAQRRSAPYTLDWLRAERRRLELELRLIGVFGLTPPPADASWGERRRERELDWRRRALRRLRWQLPLTWGLHWLLRVLTLGVWGRT